MGIAGMVADRTRREVVVVLKDRQWCIICMLDTCMRRSGRGGEVRGSRHERRGLRGSRQKARFSASQSCKAMLRTIRGQWNKQWKVAMHGR
jgi:hypothetical protein